VVTRCRRQTAIVCTTEINFPAGELVALALHEQQVFKAVSGTFLAHPAFFILQV